MNIIKPMLIIGFLFLFMYFYARYLERSSLYYPDKNTESTPQDAGITYEDVFFSAADKVKLHGWFIPAAGLNTIIFCHGNGGNISHRIDKISFFHNLGVNIFMFDYRGYGKSAGRPSEAGLYQDAQAAYEYVKSRTASEKQKIIIYGESLGGAVAVDLASKVKADGLILESTFSNVADMARVIYPFLPEFLIKSKFNSIAKITDIKIPKLFMHSEDDNIVPFKLGKKLFDTAGLPKTFLKIEGIHNDAFYISQAKIKPIIKSFLESI
ncbi:MAG: alpha/beta hydrolase [Candidatus Omnitrophota bacterium]